MMLDRISLRERAKEFYISRMTEHDLLEVVAIEETCGLSLWGWNAYHAELSQRETALMFVARQHEFAGYENNEQRLTGFIVARMAAGDLHINNIAVHHEFRRYGIGSALLQSVLEESRRKNARQALLEVRVSNVAARKLYERHGFEINGRRRNYYNSPTEDALLMIRTGGTGA